MVSLALGTTRRRYLTRTHKIIAWFRKTYFLGRIIYLHKKNNTKLHIWVLAAVARFPHCVVTSFRLYGMETTVWAKVLAGLTALPAMQLALQPCGRTPNCSHSLPFQSQFPLAFYIFPLFSGAFVSFPISGAPGQKVVLLAAPCISRCHPLLIPPKPLLSWSSSQIRNYYK